MKAIFTFIIPLKMRLIRIILLLIPLFLMAQEVISQEAPHKSIHEQQNELYDSLQLNESESNVKLSPFPRIQNEALTKRVMGYYPYWLSTDAYLNFDYSALTALAYFSFEVDPSTGYYTTIRNWLKDPAIDYAKAQGLDIILTATNFGVANNRMLLSDTNKVNRLVNELITVLKARNGDGINVDFESVPADMKDSFTSFLGKLRNKMDAEIPGSELSVAAPAVDWNGSWDITAIAGIVDYIMIMGYDYYWSGSEYAGPVAPLEGANYNVTRSVNFYLSNAPASKILLGVPWYGIEWITMTGEFQAPVAAKGIARTYNLMKLLALEYSKDFSDKYKVPWIKYFFADQWHEAWYDDSLSLALKYNFVNEKDLAGIGIWALGYQGEGDELWQGIRSAFSKTSITGKQDNPDIKIRIEGDYLLIDSKHVIDEVSIYDTKGANLYNHNLQQNRINISGLASGVYLLVIEAKKRQILRKFIK